MTRQALHWLRNLAATGLVVLTGAAMLGVLAVPASAAHGPRARTHSAAQRGVRTPNIAGAGFTQSDIRLLDTRTDAPTGPVTGLVPVMVTNDVPTASTVELTLTAVAPTGSGYVTAYSSAGAAPATSNLDYVAGPTKSAVVVVAVPANGIISLNVVGAPINLIVDQHGYFSAATLTAGAPARIGDSRSGTGFSATGPQTGVVTLTIPTNAVPAGSGALALNVTTQSPVAGAGYVTVYSGGAAPRTSSLNYTGGVVSNLVFVTPTAGVVSFNVVGRPTNLIVDIDGYAPSGSTFVTTGATRVVDTRVAQAGPIHGPVTLQLTSAEAPTGTTAVALNITTAAQIGNGWVNAYPTGGVAPFTSELQFHPGGAIAQTIVVPVSSSGTVTLNVYVGSAQLIVDYEG